MLGKDAVYVPGWDCHGLPIEWKIEESYRAAGQDKDAVPILEFRRECRAFAEHWIEVQRAEFKRLGVIGDWATPTPPWPIAAEAQIVREIGKFLLNGGLYSGVKPVLWSVVEKTALAEAEVEYQDHTSTTIFVRFPVVAPSRPELPGAAVVIWTTTPWTMPGNRAVAYGEDIDYGLIEVAAVADGAARPVGEAAGRGVAGERSRRPPASPGGARSPAAGQRPRRHDRCAIRCAAGATTSPVPLLPAGFVTADQGTGFVHIAPGHGADDCELGARHGLPVPDTVAEDGLYLDHVPLFAGPPRGQGGRAGDRRAGRARRAAGARPAGPQLSRIPGAPRRR